jgi:hypothetical protein
MNSGSIGIFNPGDVSVVFYDTEHYPAGLYVFKTPVSLVPFSYEVKVVRNGAEIVSKSVTDSTGGDVIYFIVPINTTGSDQIRISLTNDLSFVTGTMLFSDSLGFSTQFTTKRPNGIVVKGRNLISDDFYDYNNWTYESGSYDRFYQALPKCDGLTLTASAKHTTESSNATLLLQIKRKGSSSWTPAVGGNANYLLTNTGGENTFTFTVNKGDELRLSLNPRNESALAKIKDVQIIQGRSTSYIPYVAPISKQLPASVVQLFVEAKGLSADVCDHVDLSDKTFVTMVGSRLYQAGDEDNRALLTNGTHTLYPLESPIIADISSFFVETEDDLLTDDVVEVEGGGFIIITGEGSAYDANFQEKI